MKLNMQGRLSKCLLLAYRTPAESVRDLLPRGLELMTHGPWAFWNVVMCEVEAMRPTGLPRVCGISYRHAAYRLYVKAATQTQGRLRGLYFVKSEADHCLISRGGNLMSDFRFRQAKIDIEDHEEHFNARIASAEGDAAAAVKARVADAALAPDSCFDTLDEARAMLKYQPLGLSVSADAQWLRLAEVFRDEKAWRETNMQIDEATFDFFAQQNQHDLHLELATRIAPLEYRWRLGRRVRLAADQGLAMGRPASFQTRKPPSMDQTLV